MEMTEEIPRRRAQRSDKGQVRITERDILIFNWLSSMKAIYEPDLAVLIQRLTGSRPGDPAVRALTRRWRTADVAEARKLLANRPRIVRLLAGGARLAGEENFKATAEYTQYHQAEVSRVRLWMEGTPSHRHGAVTSWESEREFRQHSAQIFGSASGIQVPDGVVTFADGTRASIEVERSPKSQERLRTILGRSLAVYDEVIYAIPADPRELAKTGKLTPGPEIATAVRTADLAVRQQNEIRGTKLGALRIIAIPEEVS